MAKIEVHPVLIKLNVHKHKGHIRIQFVSEQQHHGEVPSKQLEQIKKTTYFFIDKAEMNMIKW